MEHHMNDQLSGAAEFQRVLSQAREDGLGIEVMVPDVGDLEFFAQVGFRRLAVEMLVSTARILARPRVDEAERQEQIGWLSGAIGDCPVPADLVFAELGIGEAAQASMVKLARSDPPALLQALEKMKGLMAERDRDNPAEMERHVQYDRG